ncbi:hypothetical protein VTJ49DRAFT_4854 [Mycothermus thermophilus]|uniref:Zn(2)-C6 fungal-type domain-containing protein n=1 Tax=Humicola insolens TaxID=85995 RepID=A0ABR3VLD3_HUMIN
MRQIGVCIGCHVRKVRCVLLEGGPCLKCRTLNEPCVPYRSFGGSFEPRVPYSRVTEASVFREQVTPNELVTKRWLSMELVDITDWADDEVRTIQVSLDFVDAPFELKVRRFIPRPTDLLEEIWCDEQGRVRRWPVPPYAIMNMREAAKSMGTALEKNVANYINALIDLRKGVEQTLLWGTYYHAFRHMSRAKTSEERALLADAFRLWMFCRQSSHPDRLVGDEYLGMRQVDDPQSPFKDQVTSPPVLGAQLECIMYTCFLRPLRNQVLDRLVALIQEHHHRVWYTVYLVMFILLHSCSMITNRDHVYATRVGLRSQFANTESIYGLMHGANILLVNFHAAMQGSMPFRLIQDGRLSEVVEKAELTAEQVDFIAWTVSLSTALREKWNEVREKQDRCHDFYWVSQLYDGKWKRAEIR